MRSLRERAASAVLCAASACGGCSTDRPSPAASEHEAGAVCDGGGALTYESFAGPFFLDWCTGCHSSGLRAGERQDAPIGVDFDTIEGIRAHAADIVLRVADLGNMPPTGGPEAAERAALAEWIRCGLAQESQGFSPALPDGGGAAEAGADSGPPMCDAAVRLPRGVQGPYCAPETLTCIEGCAATGEDEDAIDACRDACQDGDPTPPTTISFIPVDCSLCDFLALLDCAADGGCFAQAEQLRCCLDTCLSAGISGCFEARCARDVESFALCAYYQAEDCLDRSGEYRGGCYGPP